MKEEEIEENKKPSESPEAEESKVFSSFIRKTGEVSNQDHARIFRAIPFIIFLVGLAMLHIANNHNAENKIRSIERMEKELKEDRWEFMSTKSDLMLKSRQSEVAKLMEASGVLELRTPPQKIIIKKSEYQ